MKIKITPTAEKILDKLDAETRASLLMAIKTLKSFPHIVNVKKLKANENLWRLRKGNWRILFELKRTEETIYIIYIGKRKEVYRRLGK